MSLRTVVPFAAVLVPVAAGAQTPSLEWNDPGWEFSGQTEVVSVEGRSALRIRSGRAIHRGVALRDGTIEFDIRVTGYRSFVYLQFRMQSDTEYEDLYLRPHKSMLPDAIQYTPVYRGASNWQLYHLAGFTAPAPLPPREWVHVRVEVMGTRAAVFVGDVAEPSMVIHRLARDPASGYVALRGFLPRGSGPDDAWVVDYANLVVRPNRVSFDFSTVESADTRPAGTIRTWSLSRPFSAGDAPIETLPVFPDAEWSTVPADQGGLVVFGRHVDARGVARRPAVLARVTLRAVSDVTTRFNFGYSDDVSVFLNGRLLYAGNASYSYNLPRRQGLIGLDQAALYLPLRRGDNELILAIGDVFGGWGVMGEVVGR